MGNILQKRAAVATSEAIRKGKGITKGKILRKAGYKRSTSLRPSAVFDSKGFKEELRPLINSLKQKRQAAIAMMDKKIKKAKYRDLVDGVDKLTKNIQLLEGKETSREGFVLKWKK